MSCWKSVGTASTTSTFSSRGLITVNVLADVKGGKRWSEGVRYLASKWSGEDGKTPANEAWTDQSLRVALFQFRPGFSPYCDPLVLPCPWLRTTIHMF